MRIRRPSGKGQVFALSAIALTSVIAIAGLVVDVGSWYQRSRQAQAAADAAATAGAGYLPADVSSAESAAQTYVDKNISGATTTTVTPYNSQSDEIQVTVQTTAATYFTKIFGIESVDVTAHAIAKRVAGINKWAVFAFGQACSSTGISVPAAGTTIVGSVRSNGSGTVNGNSNSFGSTSYGGPNGCTWSQSGSGDTYGGAASPTRDATSYAWPEPWDRTAIPCTYSGTSFSFNTTNATIPSGTYCATSQISLSADHLKGTVTFIAPKVQMSGSYENLTPYYQDLLIDHYGTTNFNIAGSSQTLTGTIFVPSAQLGVSGSSGSAFNLFLEALTITINGNNWTLNGTGPPSGYGGTQLIG